MKGDIRFAEFISVDISSINLYKVTELLLVFIDDFKTRKQYPYPFSTASSSFFSFNLQNT
jgi:hypothetical protein